MKYKKHSVISPELFQKKSLVLGEFKLKDRIRSERCAYCYAKPPKKHRWTIDHIVPLSLDGPDNRENWATACHDCNNRKSNKQLIHYLLERHNETKI